MTEYDLIANSEQLGELALDAAIETESFIHRRGSSLAKVKELVKYMLPSLKDGEFAEIPEKIDLSYIPFYESAFASADIETPTKVDDIASKIRDLLEGFLSAQDRDDQRELERIRDFCLSVHKATVRSRMDFVITSQSIERVHDRA